MPDTFFRIFLYGAATVVLGAAVVIVADRFTTETNEPALPVAAAYGTAGKNAFVEPLSPQRESDHTASAMQHASAAEALRTPAGGQRYAAPEPAATAAVVNRVTLPEPMIRFSGNAVEFTVPVDPRSGMPAALPIAVAIATDPAGVPESVLQDAQKMAADFMENIRGAAAMAATPADAAYYRRWADAAFLSDRAFKARYGRVAYVQMNLMAGQEARAAAR